MKPQEITVVLLTDLVSGKNDDILRIISLNERNVLIDRICRSLVPVGSARLLIRRKYMNAAIETVQIPGLSVSDILVQHKGLILSQDSYRINS